jgi:hypothetical protein
VNHGQWALDGKRYVLKHGHTKTLSKWIKSGLKVDQKWIKSGSKVNQSDLFQPLASSILSNCHCHFSHLLGSELQLGLAALAAAPGL